MTNNNYINLNWHISTWLLIWLTVLNILDFETTLIAIGQGAVESNPILNFLIMKTGTVWVILWAKMAVFSILLFPYILIEKYRKRCQTKGMVIVFSSITLIYLIVVITTIIKIVTYS